MNIQASPTTATRAPESNGDGRCYHCGEQLPPGGGFTTCIGGHPRPMCCAGCQAVAQTIVEAGLEDYYELRTAAADRGRQRVPDFLRDARLYAEPEVAKGYLRGANDSDYNCTLLLQDLECSACCWLIERQLAALAGIAAVNLNYSTARVRLRFDPARISLAEILSVIARLGYRALPYDPERTEMLLADEDRSRLKRLGLAGLFGMQIMLLAVALYSGEWWGMAAHIEQLLRWTSALMSLPIIGYCALPFFSNALRSLRNRTPGMDVPVSLGMVLAFGASLAATVGGQGRIYFDSLAMFVFFLTLARYLEFLARRRAQQQRELLLQSAPELARRVIPGGTETVAVAQLQLGDQLRVLAGDAVPADARILKGAGGVDESLLSGESRPVAKRPGDTVIAGSINLDQPLEIEVLALGRDRVIARILELVDHAAGEKPALALLADRIAGIFVVLILLLAAGVAGFWLHTDPQHWLEITLAVLVVTCPCALSLATPAALTAAGSALARAGIIPARGLRLEQLAAIDHVIFDKTGTLTRGDYQLHESPGLGEMPAAAALAIAAALESHSLHPLARALVRAAGTVPEPASGIRLHNGEGLQGDVGGHSWWLGSAAWMRQLFPRHPGIDPPRRTGDSQVILADAGGPVFVFELGDELRAEAPAVVRGLKRQAITASVCSGDDPRTVTALSRQAGIGDARGGCLPADKLQVLKGLQSRGTRVAMVGDGVNDAPVLAGADVSFALGSGAQSARASADFILLGEHLPALNSAIDIARRTRRIIAQNLAWAVLYNLLAVPAAAAGWVAPWMAAIGMSLSSLLVVGNSLRCGHTQGRVS